MAVTCGFFNALEHDRLYDAIQMSSIFDGIIRDGIFSTIGTSMAVTASGSGLVVNVGAGRAWFNHTWILNDTLYPVEAEAAEVVLDRIDALVIEVNQSAEIRDCSIKFVKGTPSSRPVRPTMIHNAEVNQYALAYISIRAGQTTIFQADITSVIGNDETPFVTGLLQQTSIESIVAQWQDEFYTYFNNFRSTTTSDFNTWMAARVAEYNAWYASMEAEGQADLAEFDSWFQEMKDQLSEDAAGHLQAEIDALELSAEKGSVVIVTTSDDTLINHACTISQGSSERNATFDINRTATFESVPFIGDMHITSTNGTLIANKDINIPYFGRYNYDLEFWEATLAISSSSIELYERPITITKGGTTVGTTSFDNTGHATFKVHEPGTYTVTSTTTGGVTFTANVVVTEETSYPVDLGTHIGKTALPTDDIQLWLKCGSEYDCDYTTLAEVLADPELFARLCADSNACDYMARSTTWALGVGSVPTMTSNTTPSGECISSYNGDASHPTWHAFDNNESTYSMGSASTLSSGQYIGYVFPEAKKVRRVGVYAQYAAVITSKVQYSDDGSTWQDTGTEFTLTSSDGYKYFDISDNRSHRYWRLLSISSNTANYYPNKKVQFFEDAAITTNSTAMQIIGMFDYCANALLENSTWCDAICNSPYFESVLNTSIPTMTSDSAPKGRCFSSNGYSGYYAYMAFDKKLNTYFVGATKGVGHYVGYIFTEPVIIKKFFVQGYYYSSASANSTLTKYKIQTYDGTNWVDLSPEYTYAGGSTGEYRNLDLDTPHTYYRIYVTAIPSGDQYTRIAEFNVFGRTETAEDIITIHSAANDTIYYMDGQTPVTLATTDANGMAVINAEDLDTNNIVLYSTIAKNPDNLSNAYSKNIKITKYTKEIYLMPITSLYWYGYKNPSAEELSTANGWSISNGTLVSPVYNTNYITVSNTSTNRSGFGTKYPMQASNLHAVAQGVTASGTTYGGIYSSETKFVTSYEALTSFDSASMKKYNLSTAMNRYLAVFSTLTNTRSSKIYALWYE